MRLEELIIHYGYLALFLGTFFEGETILIVAGYLAHNGILELPLVILFAFLGSFAGDQSFFYLGRSKGISLLEKHPPWQRKAKKVFPLLKRYQIAVSLGFRFLYGVRNVTPFVIGASGLSPWRFFMLNMLGAISWAAIFGVLGFQLGVIVERSLHQVKEYEMFALGGMLLLALLYFIGSNVRKK